MFFNVAPSAKPAFLDRLRNSRKPDRGPVREIRCLQLFGYSEGSCTVWERRLQRARLDNVASGDFETRIFSANSDVIVGDAGKMNFTVLRGNGKCD